LVSSEEAARHGDPAKARAAEIDPNRSQVKAQLAGHLVWSDWDWNAGEAAFLQALESDPTDSSTRGYYSQLLFYLNRDQEALREVERAAELDPFNSLTQSIYAQDLNFLHRYEDAEAVLLDILERDSESPYALSTLRTTYHLMGRQSDAMRMFRASYAALGDTEAVAALDAGYEAGGYAEGLLAVAELFVARSDTVFVTPWQIATLYTRAGDGELALDYLEEALEARDQNMPSISVDPIFDFLRDEPRFQALIHQLGLPR
jgi:tetratricopeptide (TPR) repeat protein